MEQIYIHNQLQMKKMIRLSLLLVLISGIIYYVWPQEQLVKNQRIDKIVVNKTDRQMIVYYKNEEIARYTVSLGSKKWPSPKWGPFLNHDDGPKNRFGDAKTPEGEYRLSPSHGKYQPALKLNYEDIYPGQGGGILIHGPNQMNKFAGKFMRWVDWTDGCIALTESEMKEIYNAVKPNCYIQINH